MADLVTLAVLKSWLSIPSSQDGSDTILESIITDTSADFLRAIDRFDFLAADYVEVRDGDGDTRLSMRHWPINTIASITVAGTAIAASSNKVATGYYFDQDLDPERQSQIWLAGGATFTDAAPVVVSYNAGYAEPPDDVAQAVIDWCAARYRGRDGIGVASSREAGGEHVSYDKAAAIPPSTQGVIERYKRNWPNLNKRREDKDYAITRINRTVTTVEKPQ